MRVRLIGVVGVMVMLGGCQSYNTHPIHWDEVARDTVVSEVVLSSAQDAVNVALVGNPEINALRLKEANARRVARQTGWWEDPEFDLDLMRILPSSSHPFLMGSSLAFTIPLSGVPQAEARTAELYTSAAAAAIREKERALACDVRVALVKLTALRERVRLLRAYERDSRIRQALETAEKLNAAGEVTAGDLASAKRRRHARLHQLRTAERDMVAEENTFLRLLGLLPGTKLTLPEGDLHNAHRALAPLEPVALKDHVRVKAACARYAVSESTLETEIRRQYPDLKFGPAYSREEGMDRLGIVAGFTLPLWNRNRKGIAEAEGARDEARFDAITTWREIVCEAAAARANLQSVLDHPPAPNTEHEKAEQLLAKGELGVVDYLAVCEEIADLELEEADWRRDVCLAYEEVNRWTVDE